MKDFEKWTPNSDMGTFTHLSDAVAYRNSNSRRRLANTIGYDYYAEIIGPDKESTLEYQKLYYELRNKYYPVDLWKIVTSVFKFIKHNPIGGIIDIGLAYKDFSKLNPKHKEIQEYIQNHKDLSLIWEAELSDGSIDYDIDTKRLFLRVQLYLENWDSGY